MRAAVLACLIVAAPLFGQTPKKLVGDHEVKRGGFAQLTVEGAGKTVVWMVAPNPIQKAQIAGVLVFTGDPGSTYTVTAVVIDFNAKTVEQIEHDVKFLGEPSPPVPPTPPKPPVPPTPVPPVPPPISPLATKIRDAAVAAGWEKLNLARYETGFRVSGRLAATWIKSAGELQSAVRTVLKTSLTDTGTGQLTRVPAGVADVIDGELRSLDTLLPAGNPEKVLTDADRTTAKAIFDRIADALQEASR